MKKIKITALIICVCMALSVLPFVASAADATVPVASGSRIYANGMPIKIVAGTTTDFTNILYDIDNDGTIGDTEYLEINSVAPTDAGYNLSGYTIFGGKNEGTFNGDSNITIDSGKVGDVHGGNYYGDLTGNVTIVMNGGSVARILSCGLWNNVKGTVSVSIHGGTVRGGENEDIDLYHRNDASTTSLLIDGGTINGAIAVKATGGSFVIRGGSITETFSATTPVPTNGTSPVYKATLTLKDRDTAKANTAVSALTTDAGYTYGLTDVKTNGEGKIFVYLPADKTVTKATVGSDSYENPTGITVNSDGTATGILAKVLPPIWTDGLTSNPDYTFGGGAGTQASPYLLTSATDLAQLALNVNNGTTYDNKYFKLTTDIDFAGKYWVPIGNGNLSRSFEGVFDGDNRIISNMSVDDSTFSFNGYARYGFISWMYGGAAVKNLGLENASVKVGATGVTAYEAALLVGLADNTCTVENCFATGTVTAERKVDNVGGLVGKAYASSTINNCYFKGVINAMGGDYAGGLLGYPLNISAPSNCYVAASITSTATNRYAVTYSTSNCYYDSTLNSAVTGGIGTAKTSAEMKTAALAESLGAAFAYAPGMNDNNPCLKSFPPKITAANLALGTSMTVNYFAPLYGEFATAKMKFTMNENVTYVDGINAGAEGYIFPFKGIAPQCMGDIIKAELVLGDRVLDCVNEYSVKAYCTRMLAKDNAEISAILPETATVEEYKQLLRDILVYGGAAQAYKGYNLGEGNENVVSNGITGTEYHMLNQAETAKALTGTKNVNAYFTASGVWFDNVNRVFWKVKTSDVTKLTVKIYQIGDGGVETLKATHTSGSGLTAINAEGDYIAYSDDIKATGFDTVYKAVIEYNGEVAQAANYSIKSYVIAKQSESTSIAALVKALYNYGTSTMAFGRLGG